MAANKRASSIPYCSRRSVAEAIAEHEPELEPGARTAIRIGPNGWDVVVDGLAPWIYETGLAPSERMLGGGDPCD